MGKVVEQDKRFERLVRSLERSKNTKLYSISLAVLRTHD